MKRTVLLLPALLLLQACALPVPLQIAAWIADGVSFFTTEKSISDHGLSAVTEKDCAMWRGLKGEDVCRDDAESPVLLAEGETVPETVTPKATPSAGQATVPEETREEKGEDQPVGLDEDDKELLENNPELESFTTVGNFNTDNNRASGNPQVAVVASGPVESKPLVEPSAGKGKEPALVAAVQRPKTSPGKVTAQKKAPPSGSKLYYVIGSYYGPGYANRLVRRYKDLAPSVVVGTLKGRAVYRVAVGPFPRSQRRTIRQRLSGYGITEAWATRLNPAAWAVASQSGVSRAPQVASLP